MTASFTINAVDSEFAVGTGGNVGISPGFTRFDNPPNSSQDLMITTKDGDPEPRLFEVGDTYDVSWGGSGGGGSMTDAVVVRSDAAPGGGGIIVLEGVDQNGDTAHVIWTPGFDLEDWYWSHYSPSSEPRFFTTDQVPEYTHGYICFDANTRIATPRGLIHAGKIKVGDTVCTWGDGKQEVRWVGRKRVPALRDSAPIRFAPGTIGNFAPVKLSPQHRVLISSPWAELHFGSSEVLVPAISLLSGRGVRQVRKRYVDYVHILLDHHNLLIAEGAPCESLLVGPQVDECLSAEDRQAIHAVLGDDDMQPVRPVLPRGDAELAAANWEPMEREQSLF